MELLSFATEYTSQAQNKINFNWNGKHSSEFVDYNQQFRKSIITFIIENDQIYFPVELIRDLFLAEAKCAVEAWGIGFDFQVLGEKLLRYGKNKYLDDFLIGAFSSFDTYCASRMMNLEQYEVEAILEELKIRKNAPSSKELNGKYELGIELFKTYLQGKQREGLISLKGPIPIQNVRVVNRHSFRIKKIFRKFVLLASLLIILKLTLSTNSNRYEIGENAIGQTVTISSDSPGGMDQITQISHKKITKNDKVIEVSLLAQAYEIEESDLHIYEDWIKASFDKNDYLKYINNQELMLQYIFVATMIEEHYDNKDNLPIDKFASLFSENTVIAYLGLDAIDNKVILENEEEMKKLFGLMEVST